AAGVGVVSPSKLDADGGAVEAEVLAQGVVQIADVAEVDHPRVVGEAGEFGRRRARLRGVVDLQGAPAVVERMLLDSVADHRVELRGRNAFGPLRLDGQTLRDN